MFVFPLPSFLLNRQRGHSPWLATFQPAIPRARSAQRSLGHDAPRLASGWPSEGRVFTACVLLAWSALGVGLQAAAALPLARPTPQQVAWHHLELEMFIHIGPATWEDVQHSNLTAPLSAINPAELDTEQWADVAVSMGAKQIVFVAKHDGGFCWWQTDTTDYSVKNTPWRGGKGDVMKDLSASCRKRGLKLGVYLSPADRKLGVAVGGRATEPMESRIDF